MIYYVGITLLSGGLTYALWVQLRVMRLRESIFAIRDDLFLAAEEKGAFGDEGYLEARRRLNVMARSASCVSLPFVAYLADREPRHSAEIRSRLLQMEIDEAFERLAARVGRYLFRETATGWLISIISFAVGPWLRQKEAKWARNFVRRSMPEECLAP